MTTGRALATLLVLSALIAGSAGAMVLDRVVAVVNKDAITWLELYDDMRVELGPRLKGLTEEDVLKALKRYESRHLDMMVIKRLELQEAERLNVKASDEDIDRAIESMRGKYAMDLASYRRAVLGEGIPWVTYRKLLQEQITVSRLIDREVRSKINPESPEVQAITKGMTSATFHLRQVYLRGTDDEIRPRLLVIADAIKANVPVEELASRYSDGPESAAGGDLGVLSSEQLTAEFLSAIKDLRPGQISPPFRGKGGVHIVQVVERMDPKEAAIEDMFQKSLRQWIGALREKALIEIRL